VYSKKQIDLRVKCHYGIGIIVLKAAAAAKNRTLQHLG
jgi:hypothetical protein